MSRESYSVGFCKAAMARGVDPLALAEIALFIKRASSSQPAPAPEPEVAAPTAVPERPTSFGDDVSKWWNGLEEWQRSLIGVGGGALLGGAIQGSCCYWSGLECAVSNIWKWERRTERR
jgi:hypothetical protein